MARSGTTRSQKATQASQAQPRATQRTRRGAARQEEEDAEEENEAENGEEDVDMEAEGSHGRRGGDGESEIARKANDLVRLALFMEQKRTPLRREDISKKVLGSNTRAFNAVLEHAQIILRKTFAMELVELRSRAAMQSEQEANGNDHLDEARKATGVKKKAVAAGSKTYILRSVLDPLIIEYAALTDEQILEEEAVDAPDDDDDEDELRIYGSIIAWNNTDHLGPMGILYVILALILVNGRVISDMDLRANLKRLHLPPNASVPFTARSTHRSLPLDAYLTQLIRQGYIERSRIGDPKGGAGGGKRGRATQAAGDDSGATWEWRWGNRAASEVGEVGIARFVAEFMVENVNEGGGEDEEDEAGGGSGRARRKAREDEAKKKLEKMMKGIERAAGGELSEIK